MNEPSRLPKLFWLLAIAIVLPTSAAGQSLTWHFEQIYSNPDGNAQYAVVYEYANNPDQDYLVGASFTSVHSSAEHAHDPGYISTFIFPKSLPSTQTAGRRMLIGTQAFADLNIVAPDYIVENQFIPQQTGYLSLFRTYTTQYDVVGYAALPSNGVDSLYRDGTIRQNLATNFAGQNASVPLAPPAGATTQAVEYYYADWNHYFVTAFADEIASLDGGAFNGNWKRTGQTFKVWTQGSATTPAACRFFSTNFAPKSSHFYTPFATECVTVKQNRNWQFEAVAFYMQLADANGNCAADTVPLYRLYNNGMGGAPNHRYTTSATLATQMITAGWVFEGNGNANVFACLPK